jgi:predicted ester cyclase
MRTATGSVLSLALALGTMAAPALASAETLKDKALVDRYGECWQLFNKKSWDEFSKCYGKDSVSTAPGLPPAKGAAQIIEKHAKPLATAMPDVAGEWQLTLAAGNRVFTVALMRGTHTGPLAGPAGTIPATNKKFGQLVVHGIESGPAAVASKEWFIQDSGTFLAQLGLSKAPARAALTKGAAERPVVIATGSATEKANLAAAKKAYQRFNKQDKALFDLFADDVIQSDQTMPADIKGKEANVEAVKGFWGMSSKGKLDMPIIYAAGDYVVAVGHYSGTNDGDHPGMGLKKTGKKFNLDTVEITKWRDGKVVELWPFIDGMQLAMQLGLVPTPGMANR